MTVHHAAVWIDHVEAKIFHIEPEGFEVSKVKAPHHHLARKTHEPGRHVGSDDFFHQVAVALKDVEQVLVVGPASAKLDFIRHLHRHDPALEPKVVGVETLDHPTDNQLVAYVRHYFRAKDRFDGIAP